MQSVGARFTTVAAHAEQSRYFVKFGRILMYLNVTLRTLNMVCRKFKIYISSFSST